MFRYPSKIIHHAALAAGIAIGAPIIPLAFVQALLFLLGLSPIDFDLERLSPWLICFIVVGWTLLMTGNIPRAYAYFQRFGISSEGIIRHIPGIETLTPWGRIRTIEKHIRPRYEGYRWIDETSLIVKSENRTLTIYDKLEDFESFKTVLSAKCRELSIPQFSVDETLTTLSRIRKEDPALYRRVKRSGLRVAVDCL